MGERRRNAPRSFGLALSVVLLASVAGVRAAGAAESPAPAKSTSATFGIDVGDRDDSVAKMLQLSGGLRVLKIEPGSLGSKVAYPGSRRALNRGDFILKIRVKGIDAEDNLKAGVITTPTDFENACRRASRLAWEQPGHKATLQFDVYTQAGYNMEDWKTLTFEAPLDLTGQPEPPKVDTTPMKASPAGST